MANNGTSAQDSLQDLEDQIYRLFHCVNDPASMREDIAARLERLFDVGIDYCGKPLSRILMLSILRRIKENEAGRSNDR